MASTSYRSCLEDNSFSGGVRDLATETKRKNGDVINCDTLSRFSETFKNCLKTKPPDSPDLPVQLFES